jgi:hypothetical protein
MADRKLVFVIVAASVMVASLARNDVAGQSQTAAPSPRDPVAPGAKQARTSWGDPDLQGIWSSGYIETPVERPDSFKGREFLTDEEVLAEHKRLADKQDHSTGGSKPTAPSADDPRPVDFQPYNTAFSGRGRDVIRTRRTSQIVDPADGKIPWRADVKPNELPAVKAVGRQGRLDRVDPDAFTPNASGGIQAERANPEDLESERCLGVMLPIRFGDVETGGALQRIVQSPGFVSIYYEYGPHGGVYRTIPLNKRPSLPPSVRQWLGEPVGRWEDNTLVVDTTNFTDRTPFWGARDNLHLVERFTRTAPDLIMYYATIEDPTVYTRPWTIEIPLTKKDDKANQIYESACHEGNYGLTGILSGARVKEREAAAKKPGDR